MQSSRLFGHEQGFIWREMIVDSTFTGKLTGPCTETISSTSSKGLYGRYIKGSAAIFANGVN